MNQDDEMMAQFNGWRLAPEKVTLGRVAWLAVIQRLYAHDRPVLEELVRVAEPDDHGRITLWLDEYLLRQVLPAIDDAVYDQLEEDNLT